MSPTCVHIVHLLYFLAMLFQVQLSGTGLRDCQEWVVSTAFLWGAKLKNKRVFIYPAWNIQIQSRIYKSSQVYIYIYPAMDLYISHGIYISSQGFIHIQSEILYLAQDIYIYPARVLYIQPGFYISSQGFTIYGHRIESRVTCVRACDHVIG